jgi:hypothetical protein
MKTRFTFHLLITLFFCFVTNLASAGVTFTATTRSESSGFDIGRVSNSTVKGWAQGENGKIEFLGNPGDTIAKGSVILTTDGAGTSTFYDSVRKSCAPWTGNGVIASSGSSASGPKKTISELEIEKVSDEAGPEIAGYATSHFVFKISYKSNLEISGKSLFSETVLIEELWTTDKLTDPALRMWLDQRTWNSGDLSTDEKIAEALAKATGVPLKRVSKLSVKSEGSRDLGTTLTLEVNSVEPGKIAVEVFKAPFRCVDEAGTN